MSTETPKFVNHMLWNLHEASFLHQLTGNDSVNPEKTCGPWRPTDCSDALLQWLDLGMVQCESAIGYGAYPGHWVERARIVNSYYIFDAADARELLADTGSWEYPGIGWYVQVSVTQEHLGTPDEDWTSGLSIVPDELPQ